MYTLFIQHNGDAPTKKNTLLQGLWVN